MFDSNMLAMSMAPRLLPGDDGDRHGVGAVQRRGRGATLRSLDGHGSAGSGVHGAFRRPAMCRPGFTLLTAAALSAGCFADEPALPTVVWDEAIPAEDLGAYEALATVRDTLAQHGTKAFLVAREGIIIHEWYASDFGVNARHYTASLGKALVGGMALLVAFSDGLIEPDDLAREYIQPWRSDGLRASVTVSQLATHSSGIEDAEEGTLAHSELTDWKGEFWRQAGRDPISLAVEEAPVLFAPGTSYAYSNPGYAALAYALTASLRETETPDIRSLLARRVMAPIGIPDEAYVIGYDRPEVVDGMDVYATWGGAQITARAAARVGQLMLQRGMWNGKEVLAPLWVDSVVRYAGTPLPDRGSDRILASTLGWYSNFDGTWPDVPRDAFLGIGAGHQILLVIPSLDLVVVRMGERMTGSAGDVWSSPGTWSAADRYVATPVVRALDMPPYPQSRVVRGVQFAPLDSVTLGALDSDNWPITWGDDDALYTSYGDGFGFEPRTREWLSQGFAKVLGSGSSFDGYNIRSESGERFGGGAQGPKASGMLMVDGMLYMLVRNVANSRIAWSEDYGETWTWGFVFDSSFGIPTFLNFGPNYSGARDEYVYVYSSDGPSAYEPYDGLVLARAHHDSLRLPSAYEYFVRTDEAGEPLWSRDVSARGLVFEYQNHSHRSEVVYHPGLDRYVLALGYNFYGGWGLFDAPTPWGPWTTMFHTQYWGVGETQSYRLPTKWIDPEDNSMYVVFSGRVFNEVKYDAFSSRRIDIIPAAPSQP